MAEVNLLSIEVRDYVGGTKTIPLYFPATATLAQMQAFADDFLPKLSPTIDAYIVSASVTLQLTLPSGLDTTADTGNTVHEGALLAFDADDTAYRFSTYIPSWKNAGFAGDEVTNTGAYATLITDILTGEGDPAVAPSDKNANDLATFIAGKRVFRK